MRTSGGRPRRPPCCVVDAAAIIRFTEYMSEEASDLPGPPGSSGWIRARALGRVLLDFVLPPQCLACRARTADHPGLCARCWSKVEFIDRPCCARTGRPFAYDAGDGAVSAAALAEPPPWERARAAAAFGDVVRDLVHALKYRDRMDAGQLMGRLMTGAGATIVQQADMLVPVPLYRGRLWRRRFNQAAVLTRVIGERSGTAVRLEALARTRATRAQVGLNMKDRRRNVRGAFAVADGFRDEVAGRRVVLVDDVITTGATAGACTTALLDAGAASVDVLAFALVTGPAQTGA